MRCGGRAILYVYRPMLTAFDNGSRSERLLGWYVSLGLPEGASPVEQDGDVVWLQEPPP